MSVPDWLSASRLVLVAVLWPFAVLGESRLLGLGVVLAGLTDVLDGRLARRMRVESRRGARIDAIADAALLVSVAAWLEILHPKLAADNAALLTVTASLYAVSIGAGLMAHGRPVDPRQPSAKIAGGLLYGFALFTLLSGIYEPMLLAVAAAALAVSSLEAILRALAEIRTIHASGIASVIRSHAPHASNEVPSKARATMSIATSATPTANDSRP